MTIHYVHGGGYTELGGIREFLEKIKPDFHYERLFPAIYKPSKKSRIIKKEDSGVTGKNLFEKTLERINYFRQKGEINFLIFIDDGDCLVCNKETSFIDSLNSFLKYLQSLEIKVILLFFQPEIEKLFCIDKSWIQNQPCGDKDLHKQLNALLSNINFELNIEKNSCKEKFSLKFEATLSNCGVIYSKRNDGPKYLKVINPSKIAEYDKSIAKFINQLKTLK